MASSEIPSPTLSHMPPPNNKRSRPSNTVPSNLGATNPPRLKRRKPEDSVAPEDRRSQYFAQAMKGKEDDYLEPVDIKTKINFLELPVETLYKYLEYHDLLPRWDVSPWSEDACTPPNALYTTAPIAQPSAPTPPPRSSTPSARSPSTTAVDRGSSRPPTQMQIDETLPNDISSDQHTDLAENAETAEENMEPAAPRTTRSRTLPNRKIPTPSPPPVEVKRGVMTLSDVHSARAVLAEKANSHWIKGLGGGQNQESSTIVAFLYKNKVGDGRLLRLYNPAPPAFP